MFLYHFPLLSGWELQYRGWELQYRIRGCFHPVHVHSPVFLEQSLPFTSSTTRPVNLGVVCLPARATGVVTRPPSSWRCCQRDAPSFFVSGCALLLDGDAASVMRPRIVMRGDDSAPAHAEMCKRVVQRGAGPPSTRPRARECARVVRAAHVGPHAGMHKEFCRGEEFC